MSTVRKLLHVGTAFALVLGMQCQPVAAITGSSDSQSYDIIASTGSTVRSITPDFRSSIQRKKAINSDVVGWLYVPDTDINHPIVQNPNENNYYSLKNNYYLNNDFYGRPDKDGTYCADHRASFGTRDRMSRITALYGHSWDDDPDGRLFSQLKRYRDPDFAREHPYIFFSTEAENMAWEVFAVFDTTIYLPYVRPNLANAKYYQTLDMIHDLTYYSYDVPVSDTDRVLVLSTCTYNVDGHSNLPELNDYRFVVMAKLVDTREAKKETATFAVNQNRLSPDATYALWQL